VAELVYYVADSEDGFIAGPNGELDWLHPYEGKGTDHGYAEFVAGVDALVMGRATFDATRGFGPWPYGDRPAWVLTHRPATAFTDVPATVRFTADSPQALAQAWRDAGLGRVWLVGGGEVAAQFVAAGLLDELRLFTVPVTLGRGIGLFGAARGVPARYTKRLEFVHPSGIVERRWRR
jgi:dihydrofolate reductase